ncbi:DUF2157 domain-containing protein [Cupriavidus basilensis]
MREALADWRWARVLGADGVAAAWPGTEPDAAGWRTWLDRALAGAGRSLLCTGVIVFFAFNWQDSHKFATFGLLAAALTLLAGVCLLATSRPTWLAAPRCAAHRWAAGVLLAVIGQVYQTGADASASCSALWARRWRSPVAYVAAQRRPCGGGDRASWSTGAPRYFQCPPGCGCHV